MTRPLHSPKDWNGDVELALLRRIVANRAPDAATLLEEIPKRKLTRDEREFLREIVSDEMLANGGLNTDGELNEYGNRLDLLIEWLGLVSEWDD